MARESKGARATRQATLERLERYFRAAVEHPTWQQWREDARTAYQYKEGDQWSSAEKTVLDKRGQPATVNNQVAVTIGRLVGQFVTTKTKIGFRGRNAPEDQGVADVLSQLFLFIRQQTGLEFEEREVAEDGFTGGIGVDYTDVTFDALFHPSIRTRRISPFEIFLDPESRRYDPNEDAQFICWAKWLDLAEAQALYPQHANALASLNLDHGDVDTQGIDEFRRRNFVSLDSEGKTRKVRLVECWYQTPTRERIAYVDRDDGTRGPVAWEDLTKAQQASTPPTTTRLVKKLKVGVFTSHLLLEHKDTPHGDSERYPFTFYFEQRKEDGQPYSRIMLAKSMQDAINKRESKALHLLNADRVVYEENAVGDKLTLAKEMARPDGQIELRAGTMRNGAFQIDKNTEVGVTQFQMHDSAIDAFRKITGVNTESLGEKSEVRSGVGIARKQAASDLIGAPPFDNFRRTRRVRALLYLDLIRHYFTEPQVLLITDDLQQTRALALNDETLQALKTRTYDVVVDDLPDTATLQQEQVAMLMQALPALVPLGPAWMQIVLQLTDLRNKDELLAQVQELSQAPPPQPTISMNIQWAEATPEEKVAIATQLGWSNVAQAVIANPVDTGRETRQATEIERTEIQMGAKRDETASKRFAALLKDDSDREGNPLIGNPASAVPPNGAPDTGGAA